MSDTESTAPRRTPLYDLHVELGGKMVDFAGWEMPVQYSAGIMAEHAQCREKAGVFDVSHMGQVELRGEGAARKLESIVPASIEPLAEGKARYTFFTNPKGGIMDDLIVSNAGDHLFLVVNASMRDQDIGHMRANLDGVDIVELTDRALVAVQGPKAVEVVGALCPDAIEMKFMETIVADIMGASCRISRLGYTGEDGYEISIPDEHAVSITRAFLAHDDCDVAGLGARDSLRLEAGLCLYGNDIDNDTSPIEAQLNWAIQKRRREEGGFPGADRILRELADGPSRKLVGIKPQGRAPARQGVEIQDTDGNTLGHITSGGFGPTVQGPVSMGYVAVNHANVGEVVNLIVRGKALPAEIIALPFVQQNYKR
ncbi:glycine cleavage system aminomethyltransferase GcvT [Pseudohalocynthiibacter sp. F2068]|jgi:glycine cleavage system T protein (aminomethyltransferase)|uniref:glycine cleavage system aminomethyltransferase GcvT n=1 Tax=Pseudohalocynthiibacter sp. F2068 TaxID=2926418 RepID=UPI001FF23FBE|nr:glycine cleavage system aminomethyltransferase GcvT [Pseudohalocynthiibacter sp. F2068]MCK0101302.1 glycine cleavage system aminomethyltransferase GcvT [Pseudohalocynthiibacter sp. F2068]